MELLNEQQRPPFAFACFVTLITIVGSYFITRFTDPSPASANTFYWYMARSAGLTSYGLLSLSVLLGLSNSSGMWDKWRLRKLMTQLHQYTSLLVFPFLFFHLWGLRQDTSVPFGLATLLEPFVDRYRPIPTGLGVLTLYGWVLLIVTSYLREKIGVKFWRSVHFVSIPMFIMATLHGLFTGTDSGKLWSTLIYSAPSVLFFLLLRRRFRKSKATGKPTPIRS